LPPSVEDISHEIGFAASVGHRIVFIDHGRVLL
jgi:ABC-type polar amino acid transport system ATPase subunit